MWKTNAEVLLKRDRERSQSWRFHKKKKKKKKEENERNDYPFVRVIPYLFEWKGSQ